MIKFAPAESKKLLKISFLFIVLLASGSVYAQEISDNIKPSSEVNTFKVIINFLAGLVLFLFGITQLSNGIKSLAKAKVKRFLSKFTTNRFAGVLTGLSATTILDSSSVAVIMVIAFVNAGVLTSLQSLAVVLGANLGTTISSQIIAFNLYEYSPIPMFIGFLLLSLSSPKKLRKTGLIILGTGMIFFGLKEMGEAMAPLKDNPSFLLWMQDVENPLLGVIVGAAFTIVIQSSSATLGVIITLASQGLITLPAGIALMMGAEIGTCADTLVATIGRTKEAIKVGIFHLFFNIVSVLLGLIFFSYFIDIVGWVSLHSGLTHQIANAHLLFNLMGVFVFIWFTPFISSVLDRIIPPNNEKIIGGVVAEQDTIVDKLK